MFKVGDRVVVVKNLLGGPDTSLFQSGEVLSVQDKAIGVEVRTKDYGSLMFMPEELEFEEIYNIMSDPLTDEDSAEDSELVRRDEMTYTENRGGDVINSPSHYTRGKYEVIDIIEDSGVGYRLGNVLKYVLRADYKHDDNGVQDLSKALWYLKRELLSRGGSV